MSDIVLLALIIGGFCFLSLVFLSYKFPEEVKDFIKRITHIGKEGINLQEAKETVKSELQKTTEKSIKNIKNITRGDMVSGNKEIGTIKVGGDIKAGGVAYTYGWEKDFLEDIEKKIKNSYEGHLKEIEFARDFQTIVASGSAVQNDINEALFTIFEKGANPDFLIIPRTAENDSKKNDE